MFAFKPRRRFHSRTRQAHTAACAQQQQSEQLEDRRLLSADIALESVLKGTGTAFAAAEYKLKDGQHSLEFNIYNAAAGSYSAYAGSTLLGQIAVPASGLAEFKFASQPGDAGEAPFPGGLTLPLVPGQSIRLAPAAAGLSPEMTGQLAVENEDERFESSVFASAAGAAGQALESEYESEQEGSVTKRKFELKVYNLQPGSTQTVVIDGVTIGQVQANAVGTGWLKFADPARPGFAAFPAQFPSVVAGSQIAVGTALSGSFGSALIPVSDDPANGLQTRIPLYGTGALQGVIFHETQAPAGSAAPRREFKVEVWGGTPNQVLPVRVRIPNGQPADIGTITVNARGYGRLQFQSDDATKQFPAGFPALTDGTVFTVGVNLSGAWTANNPTAEPLPRSAELAYQLDQTYGFTSNGFYSENWGGKGEKWLKDRAGKWYFITPDGSLFEWDLKVGANGRRIAVLDDSSHLRPELLTQAKAAGSGAANDDLVKATAAKLDRELGLTLAAASNTNWGGLQEKWLRGNGKWYFITPDGTLTRWDGSKTATGTVVGRLDDRFHENPARLAEAETELTDAEKQFAAKTSLQLNTYAQSLDGWKGIDAKWVKSSTNVWYFVRPTDDVFLWDTKVYDVPGGKKEVRGTKIARITGAYAGPALLTTLPGTLPGTAASRAVLDDLFADAPDFS